MSDADASGDRRDTRGPGAAQPGTPPRQVAVAIVAAVAMGALIVVLVGRHNSQPGQAGNATVATSTDPRAFVLPRLGDTGTVRLTDYRGRPVVVNFFASWCTACRGEAPGFLKVDSDLHGAVVFIGVNSLEDADGLAFARELGYTRWPLGADVGGQQGSGLHDALRGQGMPITAFYSKEGRLLYVAPGALAESTLRSRIHELFGLNVGGAP